MYLTNQVYPDDSIILYNAYQYAIQESHGYLILDLTQDTNDGLKFRNNIFQTDKYTLNVYFNLGDETCENELSHPPRAQDGRT